MVDFIWSDIAKKEYWDNIDYLLDNWSEKEAANFIDLVGNTLDIIKHKPKTFSKVGYRKVRKVVILPQITLFYSILDSNTVEIIRFWNNSRNPESLSL